MKTQVTARVIDGTLAFDQPIELPNDTRVFVTVESLVQAPKSHGSTAGWGAFKLRLKQRPVHSGGLHFTRDQLHERH